MKIEEVYPITMKLKNPILADAKMGGKCIV
jgi:hypothetical protein